MKVIETKYGIDVTRPWNKEMYDHNDKVASLMKAAIRIAINENKEDFAKLNELMTLCGGVRYHVDSFSVQELYEGCMNEVENAPNYWLNEEWSYAVKNGLVGDIGIEMIGY